MRWRNIQWTGCEYEEDPISAMYITTVNSVFVELLVHHTETPYQVFLGVHAEPKNGWNQPGGKDLEVKHVTPFSGDQCLTSLMTVIY